MSQPAPPASKKPNRRIIFIILGALFALCVICSGLAVLLSPSRQSSATPTLVASLPDAAASPTVPALPSSTPEPTGMPLPSDTPAPTATPLPTDTPEPSATPDPDLVNPGTYLVNTELRPGLYQGNAGDDLLDSCYWARLANLSGDLDALLANANSIGQFYLEVLESDFALETACPIRFFHLDAAVPGEFPTTLAPGDYLVGIDIQPGTYRGEAGADIMDSCYWARLANFTGGLDSILANDNAVGQYYIEVGANDFGLATACELELVQ